jgi:hypothetical protein
VACWTGVVERGVWLRISSQYLSCNLVQGCGIVLRHWYPYLTNRAEDHPRDGEVVPLE